MTRRIRGFGRGIRNLWRWLPVIWQDEDFDHAYFARIISFKARLMAEHFEEHRIHTSWAREARQLRMVAYLLGEGRERASEAMGNLAYEECPGELLGLKARGRIAGDAFATVNERYTKYAFGLMQRYFLHWWC